MTDEEIRRRLSDAEDGWTERKEKGVSTDDVRKALVAFANSVPEGTEALLLIGVANDGSISGVDNAEKRQQQVSKTASHWCYPAIKHNIRVVEIQGRQVLAVTVPASHSKPHFAGPAFVRIGSRSENASEGEYKELIASRNSKAWPLLEAKRTGDRVVVWNWSMGRNNRLVGPDVRQSCVVVECTPHYVVFEVTPGDRLSADYDRITLKRNANGKLQVDIDG